MWGENSIIPGFLARLYGGLYKAGKGVYVNDVFIKLALYVNTINFVYLIRALS